MWGLFGYSTDQDAQKKKETDGKKQNDKRANDDYDESDAGFTGSSDSAGPPPPPPPGNPPPSTYRTRQTVSSGTSDPPRIRRTEPTHTSPAPEGADYSVFNIHDDAPSEEDSDEDDDEPPPPPPPAGAPPPPPTQTGKYKSEPKPPPRLWRESDAGLEPTRAPNPDEAGRYKSVPKPPPRLWKDEEDTRALNPDEGARLKSTPKPPPRIWRGSLESEKMLERPPPPPPKKAAPVTYEDEETVQRELERPPPPPHVQAVPTMKPLRKPPTRELTQVLQDPQPSEESKTLGSLFGAVFGAINNFTEEKKSPTAKGPANVHVIKALRIGNGIGRLFRCQRVQARRMQREFFIRVKKLVANWHSRFATLRRINQETKLAASAALLMGHALRGIIQRSKATTFRIISMQTTAVSVYPNFMQEDMVLRRYKQAAAALRWADRTTRLARLLLALRTNHTKAKMEAVFRWKETLNGRDPCHELVKLPRRSNTRERWRQEEDAEGELYRFTMKDGIPSGIEFAGDADVVEDGGAELRSQLWLQDRARQAEERKERTRQKNMYHFNDIRQRGPQPPKGHPDQGDTADFVDLAFYYHQRY
uniref:Uncharacterized protein n=1 Tax=Chromera velia CCMP2878 TaxID=1169474 RepID=A0A0G4H4Q6_9ALVE|eukprot:Cvel_24661.t1-p1 / transcript=Cvel_24661.t1 / gene=Cvel_24661 / organism=Chromera_velia_CCMP2878 / gene_product=hypothetical protein / transcript_product=hypothetical protein / location=Cvel_scaffold2697:3675-8029(+) / protein_length=588 / sequence_SO=supercontig / SO=protein_coding / is_pseudo=false